MRRMAAASAAATEAVTQDVRALLRMAALVFEQHGAAALTAALAAAGLGGDERERKACGQLMAVLGAAVGVDDAGAGGGVEAAQAALGGLSVHDQEAGGVHAVPDPVLLRVFEYLSGPGGRATRQDLCAALATCHRWRALCSAEALWQPAVQSLWRAWHGKTQIEAHLRTLGRVFHPHAPPPAPAPPLPLPLPTKGQKQQQGGSKSRSVLAYRGRCIAESGLLLVGPRWPERYWLNIEVQDQRDGLVLFSGVGPMACQQWTNQTEHRTILRLGGAGAIVTAQPFAARDRGPFPSVRAFFQGAHLPNSPAQLCVRVVAIDRRTGREALLYESDRHADRHCQDAAEGWPVPEGSFAVTDHADTWLAPKGGGGGGTDRAGAIRALFDFTCVPVDGQQQQQQQQPSQQPQGQGQEGEEQQQPAPAPAPVLPPAERRYQVHTGPVHPPINTIAHMGIVGLVFLAKAHEVGLLLGTLAWA